MSEIAGVGPDAAIATNERGGKQSATPYGFTLIDGKAMFKLAEVLAYGAKRYARDNWRLISSEDHLNHALQHAFAYMAGDRQDDHAGHFLCRAMMWVACLEAEKEQGDWCSSFNRQCNVTQENIKEVSPFCQKCYTKRAAKHE